MGTQPGIDGKRPPTVVFVAKRKSNKIRVTLGLGTDKATFLSASGTPAPTMGVMIEGAWFLGGRFHMLGGTLTLDESGMQAGDAVSGELSVDVIQFKGDFR